MPYINNQQYYQNGTGSPTPANWGSYEKLTLDEAITNFMIMYIGNDKQINNVKRHEVIFHMKQAIKQLNYDALREVKSVELRVDDDLKFILPPDYVNYVKISLNADGMLYPLYEDRKVNTAIGYDQDPTTGDVLFDINGNITTHVSTLDLSRITPSQYLGNGLYNGYYGWYYNSNWYFAFSVGGKFGLDTSNANQGPTFRVNGGAIDFSSDISGNLVILEYISDGMQNGVNGDIWIHKFAEEFVYAYTVWKLLSAKSNITVYDRELAKKRSTAELRNAKIRLSNLHPSRLLMSLRGQNKFIK